MTDKRIAKQHHATFEGIRQLDEAGQEFWLARQLAEVLDYSQYRHFLPVVERAKDACLNSGQFVENHMEDVLTMVEIGSGAQREISDIRLSRYACYLVVQNGDPSKPVIANGQTYFAMQTRRQELEDSAKFAQLSEDDKRLAIRNELAAHNKHLAAAAKDAGVESSLDYAIFQDHGYKGLYGGLEANAQELEAALLLVRKIAQNPELPQEAGRGLLDVVTRYARTFLLLQRYDEGLLTDPPQQQGGTLPTPDQARAALTQLKSDLMGRGEATDLFARERGDGLDALLGNLDQSVFGEPAYPTIEAKAAHLLYFVIKNHPFADGNKRSGAFLFVDFLARNGRLMDANGQPVINDIGLAALALLVAESDPTQKETLIRLIMNMLAQQN